MKKKTSATKRKLLDISKQLIITKGYNATTIEEICKTAEVTKGAFFYYFKTKEDLGVNVLNDYWQTRQREFADADWMNFDHPLDQLEHFLETVADVFMSDVNGFSCVAGIFTQELATTNLMFRSLVAELFTEWADQIKPVLQSAKDMSPADNDIDITALADHIIVVIEGAIILALARQDRTIIAKHITMLNHYLKSVLNPHM